MPTGGKAAPVKPIKVDVVSAHADDHDLDPDWRETKEIEVEIKNLATARAGGVAQPPRRAQPSEVGDSQSK